ncbi:hypothetical protein HY405_02305 [Candidatus Microgenomates bacterium]|nr:hypothetical protein [Candidatus Microgenomates bacterium]
MDKERTIPSEERQLLLRELQMNGRAMSEFYRLPKPYSQEIVDKLRRYEDEKNQLLVQALLLRKQEDTSIHLTLVGDSNHALFPESRNQIAVEFSPTNSNTKPYFRNTLLSSLKPHYDGNVVELVGTPITYAAEEPTMSVVRTIQEMHDVLKARNQLDGQGKREADILIVMLAERILTLRAEEKVPEKALRVYLLQDRRNVATADRIEISHVVEGRTRRFLLPAPDRFSFPNRLQELIDKGGGYDPLPSLNSTSR